MNLNLYDIEKISSNSLIFFNEEDLNLDNEEFKSFIIYIINNIEFINQKIRPQAYTENLFKALQLLTPTQINNLRSKIMEEAGFGKSFLNYLICDTYKHLEPSKWRNLVLNDLLYIKDLIRLFLIKEEELDSLISKSFQTEKRRQLKEKLIQLNSEMEELSLDETLASALRKEKREELKQKLIKLDIDSKPEKTKVISIKSYLKAIGIAASITLILLVWQPQHSSDKKLFAGYTNSINNTSIKDFTQTERINEQGGLRGEEEHFRNYTYNESLQLLEAIALVKQKDFEKAKELFTRLHIEKEKNPGLALYLSIAQLNTDNLDDAITNLEFLTQLPGFPYQDESKFHLAFAYLKSGQRKKAKTILLELVRSKSKFSNQAQQTLSKIRWF